MTRTWDAQHPDAAIAAIAETERLLIALDFDGTASHLVAEPMAARALPAVSEQVRRLAALPDTIVAYVSGRSLVHLREIAEHDDASPVVLAGSHGAEYWLPGVGDVPVDHSDDDEQLRQRIVADAAEAVAPFSGVVLEEKTYGIGIHGRRTDHETEERAFAAVDAFMAERAPQWRRRTGDRILEFSSRHEGKNVAIDELKKRFAPTAVLFAGDDVTDEDALAVLGAADLGIRVGEGNTHAAVRVRNPEQMAEVLAALATMRAGTRE
ncbi:trehalose-phosphatase [Microbacterium sp. YY-01]|uniref:trehalose-phosphatase n=1 Tax=Microbacterium sp. YY-01 TaxID=3421634 RepID=UPI003D180EDB